MLDQVRELESDPLGGAQRRLVATTHAPLVLASAEPWFDPAVDRLCRMERDANSGERHCIEMTFVPDGRVGYWLTSDAFGTETDRGSRRAEGAEKRALKAMRTQTTDPAELDAIQAELRATMSDLDSVWIRWGAFRENQLQ